ncbi:hypothetical protein BOTBODRAFT_131086 [Botryobasidium botryosum FD-172 SS1]|uniref:Spindle pole body component n=1 Tax=Botryobasidium botryosum (strain FD-172 SS1) TaxID=930990 RepID=A0A067MKW5_BOTB1|nr:hypothetical protein BOTBODRAFT_131086 [Botryobasidium botryosum FD-172 SS1]
MFSLPPLPPPRLPDDLPPLRALFFVPPLEDAPQNPIIDALPPYATKEPAAVAIARAPKPLEPLLPHAVPRTEDDLPGSLLKTSIWQGAANTKVDIQNTTLSWDSLRTSFPPRYLPDSSPFLSEQSSRTVAEVLEYIRPQHTAKECDVVSMSTAQLHEFLNLNLLGSSSTMFMWDNTGETFRLAMDDPRKETILVVDGLSHSTSSNMTRRFLDIGTMLRRLETLVAKLRAMPPSPTSYAFAHGLSLVLARVRSAIFTPTSTNTPSRGSAGHWVRCEESEQILKSLAALCFRDVERQPPYTDLPISETGLLSHLYTELSGRISSAAPHFILSVHAFLLTTTSYEYIRGLGKSIGLISRAQAHTLHGSLGQRHEQDGDSDDELDELEAKWPSFIEPAVARQLSRAKRSLALLTEATPTHPLSLSTNHLDPEWELLCSGWVWNEDGLTQLYDRVVLHVDNLKERIAQWKRRNMEPRMETEKIAPFNHLSPQPLGVSTGPSLGGAKYKPGLAGFAIFDLEPGAHAAPSASQKSIQLDFDAFLASFARSLPSQSPTLPLLTQAAVLRPLLSHSSLISSSLLSVVLSDLRLVTHLDLLHRFLLLGDPGFSSRLQAALFDDSGTHRPVGKGVRARTRAKLGMQDERDVLETDAVGRNWGIGLGLGLSERETWPPGGAELSFLLRRVLVDSLRELALSSEDGGGRTDDHAAAARCKDEEIMREAERRLGFALRELEEEDADGRAKWLDPMCIRALDFLYVDYNPPPCISVLMNPDVMLKYKRIFTFLLRLLRVETVSRALFHLTLKQSANVLFPAYPHCFTMLCHFRFRAQSFLSNFIAYIFDIAIGVNWNSFITRLRNLQESSNADSIVDNVREVQDVFSLVNYHSAVLDKMLEACVLKTRHKAVANVLTKCLEIILQLGKLVGERTSSAISELEGSKRLQALFQSFEKNAVLFLEYLRTLDEPGQTRSLRAHALSNPSALSDITQKDLDLLLKEKSGEDLGLGDLLLRLDFENWYHNKKARWEKKPKGLGSTLTNFD